MREHLISQASIWVRNICKSFYNDEDLMSVGMIAAIKCIDKNKAYWGDALLKYKCISWAKNAILNEVKKTHRYDLTDVGEIIDDSQDMSGVELKIYLEEVLTPKALLVVEMLKSGATDIELKETLGISDRTLRYHKTNIRNAIKEFYNE